jgi:glycosyltransferase involved in cell wall biosynthesis
MAVARRTAKNILITCATDDSVGGVRMACQGLVRTLEGAGRHVHLVYPAPSSQLGLSRGTNAWGREAFFCPMPMILSRVVWLSIPVFVLYLPLTLFHLTRFVRRRRIDVINCHYLAPHFIHLLAVARLLRLRFLVSVHGSDVASLARADWLYRLVCLVILRHADAVVACSDALAAQTSSIVPGIQHKIVRIHNAIDATRCSPSQNPPDLPEPFVLFVGRQVHVKGIDTLLRAFALIADRATALSLVLVGDGPLRQAHEHLATTLGLTGRVHFVGEVASDDVGSYIEKCAVFVLPSRAEAFGLVLLEAGYRRKPIVCTRVGGIPELIADGVNGVVVEPDDPIALGEQILALVRCPEVAERIGREAHRKVTAEFLWQDRIADYLAAYEGSRSHESTRDTQATVSRRSVGDTDSLRDS